MSVYPPSGFRTIAINRLKGYAHGLDNSVPGLDPCGSDVLPSPGTQSSETERFRYHYVLVKNTGDSSASAAIHVYGTASRYTDTMSGTYYYRVYAAWGVTASNPPTQPTSWTETTAASASFSNASAAAWYDDVAVNGVLYATVPAGQWLWLRLRGTSWASVVANSSIGFKKGNIAVVLVV
ncbi:MAG: hypothetical protein QXT28_11200 [Thermofilaceae archaeon]